MRVMGLRHQDGDVGKRLPRFRFHAELSLVSLQFTQSILANGFGLTDAGRYIIRSISMSLGDCMVMSDPMEPCLTWHV